MIGITRSVIVKTGLATSSLFRKLPEMACHVQAWGKAYSILRMQDHLFPDTSRIGTPHSPSPHKRQAQQLSNAGQAQGQGWAPPTQLSQPRPPTGRTTWKGWNQDLTGQLCCSPELEARLCWMLPPAPARPAP